MTLWQLSLNRRVCHRLQYIGGCEGGQVSKAARIAIVAVFLHVSRIIIGILVLAVLAALNVQSAGGAADESRVELISGRERKGILWQIHVGLGQHGLFPTSLFHDGHADAFAPLLEDGARSLRVEGVRHDGEDALAAVLARERAATVFGIVAPVAHNLLVRFLTFTLLGPSPFGTHLRRVGRWRVLRYEKKNLSLGSKMNSCRIG